MNLRHKLIAILRIEKWRMFLFWQKCTCCFHTPFSSAQKITCVAAMEAVHFSCAASAAHFLF